MERAACSGRGRRRRDLARSGAARASHRNHRREADGDKASRMAVASAKFEAGQVLLPERASWLPDLEAELFVFPGSRHDDQCDSISQALLDKNNSFMAWLSPEDWEVLLAESRIPRPRPPFGRHGGQPS